MYTFIYAIYLTQFSEKEIYLKWEMEIKSSPYFFNNSDQKMNITR